MTYNYNQAICIVSKKLFFFVQSPRKTSKILLQPWSTSLIYTSCIIFPAAITGSLAQNFLIYPCTWKKRTVMFFLNNNGSHWSSFGSNPAVSCLYSFQWHGIYFPKCPDWDTHKHRQERKGSCYLFPERVLHCDRLGRQKTSKLVSQKNKQTGQSAGAGFGTYTWSLLYHMPVLTRMWCVQFVTFDQNPFHDNHVIHRNGAPRLVHALVYTTGWRKCDMICMQLKL